MKPFVILLLGTIFFSCQNPKEEARKPKEKTIQLESIQPISEEVVAHAVLYEANIRQYSEEGTFNAFAKDLPVLQKMGVKILWLMPFGKLLRCFGLYKSQS